MRSVTVVLPASMWAMIPMLRTRSSGSCRTDSRASFGATATAIPYLLPAVMAEGLVGLRHLVGLFFAPHRAAGVVHRVHQLGRELLAHGLPRALARGVDEPACRQRHAPRRTHLDRHLIGCAANATRLDLDERCGIADRGVEPLAGVATRLRLGLRQRAVHDRRGNGLLAVLHHVVDELLHRDAVVARVRELLADGRTRSAWHQDAPGFCFSGAFAPYFERPCLRSRTPAASSVPRTMWYFTEGRSFTRPPRPSTTECS